MEKRGSKRKQPQKKLPKEDPKRIYFTIATDIAMLASAVQHNPWQLGGDKWTSVKDDLKEHYDGKLTARSIKERIQLLTRQYKNEELVTKTGTEEQTSERGELLDTVITILAQSSQPINIELGAEAELDSMADIFTEKEILDVVGGEDKKQPTSTRGRKIQEKIAADKERDELCASDSELADTPKGNRGKRSKLSPEDELIAEKQHHDMLMEERKHKLEEMKKTEEMAIENRKLDLEGKRLEMEAKKEDRKAAKNERRDELAKQQLDMQNTIFKMFGRFIENK